MAQITAALVKELRDKSGAGMMDAKKALVEVDGDMDAAIDWLRKKGLSKAAKKADRVAAEGLVAVKAEERGAGMAAAAVEVNAETDFVAALPSPRLRRPRRCRYVRHPDERGRADRRQGLFRAVFSDR